MKYLGPFVLSRTALARQSSNGDSGWVDYGESPMENPQFLEDMTAAGMPGDEHMALAKRAGSWRVEGRMWMEPGGEPMPMTATARTEVILGGRYTVEEYKSDFMGQPFEGRLLQGYDNLTEQYWSVWTDNMSTGAWMSYGKKTAEGRYEYEGTAKDIMTPEGRPTRMVITVARDGGYTMEMFDSRPDGSEFRSMELNYRR